MAAKLRDDIVQAVIDNRLHVLRSCPRRALKLTVDREALEVTGLGVLMADVSLWAITKDLEAARVAALVVDKWRSAYSGSVMPLEIEPLRPGPLVAKPFAGGKARPFSGRPRVHVT